MPQIMKPKTLIACNVESTSNGFFPIKMKQVSTIVDSGGLLLFFLLEFTQTFANHPIGNQNSSRFLYGLELQAILIHQLLGLAVDLRDPFFP